MVGVGELAGRDRFERGVFCLSFDFELAWGGFAAYPLERVQQKARWTRERVFPRLLESLARHRVSATWATVGHLMLEGCDGQHGHPAPAPRWFPDWYRHDPGSSERERPEWYAASLVRELLRLSPPQDVGLHGFSHFNFSDPDCSAEVARRELESGVAAARALGIEPRSFVFPYNGVAWLEVLAEHGIQVFRDRTRSWHMNLSPRAQKAAHMANQALGLTPRTVMPGRAAGMTSLPGSYLFLSMDGFRRMVPAASRVLASERGLEACAREGRVYHLYTHPINLAYPDERTPALLAAFDRVLATAAALRDAGRIEILTMAELAARSGTEG